MLAMFLSVSESQHYQEVASLMFCPLRHLHIWLVTQLTQAASGEALRKRQSLWAPGDLDPPLGCGAAGLQGRRDTGEWKSIKPGLI